MTTSFYVYEDFFMKNCNTVWFCTRYTTLYDEVLICNLLQNVHWTLSVVIALKIKAI